MRGLSWVLLPGRFVSKTLPSPRVPVYSTLTRSSLATGFVSTLMPAIIPSPILTSLIVRDLRVDIPCLTGVALPVADPVVPAVAEAAAPPLLHPASKTQHAITIKELNFIIAECTQPYTTRFL